MTAIASLGHETEVLAVKQLCQPNGKLADAAALIKIKSITQRSFPETGHKIATLCYLEDIICHAYRTQQSKEVVHEKLTQWKKTYQPCVEIHQNPILRYLSSQWFFSRFIPKPKTAILVDTIMAKLGG